jgi:solute carrier family 12 sodium/potassium/chloride transporter 2
MSRWGLIELADALSHNRGLFTVTSILPSGSRDVPRQQEMETTISKYLEKRGVQALVRVLTAPDPFEGAQRLVEIYGLGQVVPDTVLLGDSEAPNSRDRYCQLITHLHQAQRNVVIFRDRDSAVPHSHRRIDVWWGGLHANGSLMLILADLLRGNIAWRNATIHLKLVVPDQEAAEKAEVNLAALIARLRIDAQPEVLVAQGSFDEILQKSSRSADMVLLGMAPPKDDFQAYYETLQARTASLPSSMMVLASPNFAFASVLTK